MKIPQSRLCWSAIFLGAILVITGCALGVACARAHAHVGGLLYCVAAIATGTGLLAGRKWAAFAGIALGLLQIIDQIHVAVRLNRISAIAVLSCLVVGVLPVCLGMYRPFREILTDSPGALWRSALRWQ